MILNLFVIPAQAVDALDDHRIARFQRAHKLFVLRTLKILARLLVAVDAVDAAVRHRKHLAILILILR